MKILVVLLVSMYLQDIRVSGHGRLNLPASRVSAFRHGFNTPPHWSDMETHCGGAHFDKMTPSTCNICGGRPGTRSLMAPGKYGTGTITGEYRSGGTIKLKYQGTASHCGYYIVKLCKNNNPKKDICTQADFDRLILKVKGPGVNRGIQFSDGANTYPYGACSGGHRDTWEVKIPNDVSCDHCILQVDWKAGNQGRCISDTDCPAKRQEHFVTCSDIRIKSSGTVTPTGPSGTCPKTHKFAYTNGDWCCQTNKDEDGKPLKLSSTSCQYLAFKECPGKKSGKKCKNHPDVPTSPCKDGKKHCTYWKNQGFCTRSHVAFMTKHCPKSCNKC